MLPEGWKEERLDELLKNKTITVHIDGNHGSFYPKKEEFVSSGVPYISANCIQNGRIDFQKCKFLAPEKADKLQKGIAKDGDVLFAHNATVGPVALLKTSEERVILSTTLTLYRCDPIKLNNSFLYQYMSSTYFDTQYESIMRQTTRNQVPITAQREFVFLLPPLPEQKKIAAILSTWDRAIEGTEKLLANSQQQKKALMQQLLTGKKRLPGFTGEWETKYLGDIADIQTGSSNRQDSLTNGEYTFFDRSEDIRTSNRYLFDCEAVIVPGEGQDFVPKYFVGKFDLHQRTYAISCFQACDGKFIFYTVGYHRSHFLSQAVGSTVKSLRLPMFQKMPLKLPPLSEQRAIAAVLTTADEEITALESDLSRLRQEKKALMQQLLTGKRRVKVD